MAFRMPSFSAIIIAVIDPVHTASPLPLAPLLPLCVALVAMSVHANSGRGKSGDGGIELDEDLYSRALAHATNLEMETQDDITGRLGRREVEALYEVAKSMNDSGDKISSVLIWHALADDGSEGDDYEDYDEAEGYDYEGHVPSAIALGFSYYDVDKPRSLHYFLMATSRKGAPHQAAMYNAGRLYLELDDPSAALAYIRACATLDREHPAHARPQLGITCRRAYDALSAQLIEGGLEIESDLGLEEAVECFAYASIEDFPLPKSREFQAFHGAMEHLQKYAEIVRAKSGGAGRGVLAKATGHLAAAAETLMNFKSDNRDKMSKLQLYLVSYMLERIATLEKELRPGTGEL